MIAMNGCDSKHILPTFAKAALTKTGGLSDSRVSSLLSNIFDRVRNKFDALNTRINKKLSSHCNKKGSNQLLVETPSVSGPAQIFHSGWENRGRDSLWDYTYGSFTLSKQSGMALAGWTKRLGDITMGGQSPTFKDLKDRTDLQTFTDVLFEDDATGRWKPRVRELLVTALLLRHHQFCNALRSPLHPDAWIPGWFKEHNPMEEGHDLDASVDCESIKNHHSSVGLNKPSRKQV